MIVTRQIFLFLICCLLACACKKVPEFPKTPEITFLRIDKKKVSLYQGPGIDSTKLDSLTIVTYFKDGDGDLGSDTDTSQNYRCKLFVKYKGEFTQLVDSIETSQKASIIDKSGRFLSLNPDNRQGPLEGELYYSPSLRLKIYFPDSSKITVRFEVFILDNSKKASNTITTSEEVIRFYR